jgi:hypothetical protein
MESIKDHEIRQTRAQHLRQGVSDASLKNGYVSMRREATVVVRGLCERLGQVAAQCNADQAHGGGANIDEAREQGGLWGSWLTATSGSRATQGISFFLGWFSRFDSVGSAIE